MRNLILVLSSLSWALAFSGGVSADEAHPASAAGLSKIWPSTASGAPESVVYDAASAMDYFRTLSGNWEKVPNSSKSSTDPSVKDAANVNGFSIRTLARGSAVAQTYFEGTPNEMLVLLHMDGPNTLLLTHFCSARNVPVMKFVKSNKPGEMIFEFAGGTNLNPNVDGHAHSARFNVINKDEFELNGTVYHDGQSKDLQAAVFKRATLQARMQKPVNSASLTAGGGGGW